jgi:ribonuclease J
LQVTIHRGSKEIGGTCIQLTTENTTILLDAGLPLSESSAYPDISKIKTDALLISHPHQDHYGLMEDLPFSVPVYVGELSKGLIESPRMFLGQDLPTNNFNYLRPWQATTIGDFKVTPYLVDHSSPEAYAFLIESRQGQRIFYSGDFRVHGRKSVLVERLIKEPPANVDVLFLEGTMMERSNERFPDERTVEKQIFETLRTQSNISFLVTSSQNIDRIVSAYRACLKSRKTLVIDFYTAWVLELVRKVAPGVPSMDWDNVRILAHYRQDETLKANQDYFADFRKRAYRHRITKEALAEQPNQYLIISKMSQFRIMELYKDFGPINLIYSQWLGYLKYSNEQYYGAEIIADYQDDPQVNFIYAHTSGHAPLEDLKRFAAAINPKQLIPMHTEYGDDYCEHFNNVTRLTDGKSLSI